MIGEAIVLRYVVQGACQLIGMDKQDARNVARGISLTYAAVALDVPGLIENGINTAVTEVASAATDAAVSHKVG